MNSYFVPTAVTQHRRGSTESPVQQPVGANCAGRLELARLLEGLPTPGMIFTAARGAEQGRVCALCAELAGDCQTAGFVLQQVTVWIGRQP